jgi:hypothetical protein
MDWLDCDTSDDRTDSIEGRFYHVFNQDPGTIGPMVARPITPFGSGPLDITPLLVKREVSQKDRDLVTEFLPIEGGGSPASVDCGSIPVPIGITIFG